MLGRFRAAAIVRKIERQERAKRQYDRGSAKSHGCRAWPQRPKPRNSKAPPEVPADLADPGCRGGSLMLARHSPGSPTRRCNKIGADRCDSFGSLRGSIRRFRCSNAINGAGYDPRSTGAGARLERRIGRKAGYGWMTQRGMRGWMGG